MFQYVLYYLRIYDVTRLGTYPLRRFDWTRMISGVRTNTLILIHATVDP